MHKAFYDPITGEITIVAFISDPSCVVNTPNPFVDISNHPQRETIVNEHIHFKVANGAVIQKSQQEITILPKIKPDPIVLPNSKQELLQRIQALEKKVGAQGK